MLKNLTCLLHMALAAMLSISPASFAQTPADTAVMEGVPPSRESQVTFANYMQHPLNTWSFVNMGAPTHVVMMPREGKILDLGEPTQMDIGERKFAGRDGNSQTFSQLFADNNADGVVVLKGDELLYENYFTVLDRHKQHIWFSMTKSLVSTAFGLLAESGQVDLGASPAKYIPELKGSGFERLSIQNVLDHESAIDFKENYTDFESDFFRHYAPALAMAYLPGAQDAQPDSTEIYGVHDFLVKFVRTDPALKPGDAFDYNSSNADVLGWLVSRISGQNLADFIQQHIWSKLGAEHDAYLVVDRAYMPVATGGMNSTLRDAAKFGMMIRDRGMFRGERIIPAGWVDSTLQVSQRLQGNMARNPKYGNDPWSAYHNMWWLLDSEAGEYCAVGVYGQVIYVNRSANTVMAWFSSQRVASAANNPVFHAKLNAARALARQLQL